MKTITYYNIGIACLMMVIISLGVIIKKMDNQMNQLENISQNHFDSRNEMMKHVHNQCPPCTFDNQGTMYLPSVPGWEMKYIPIEKYN
mgnify:CR=1 FL=1